MILTVAIAGFIIHLVLIYLYRFGLIKPAIPADLLGSPIAAIYTPFTFILVYEVYLLVYYIPKSMTTYVSKQYEIITLIIIRRSFKDLATVELSSDWFQIKDDVQFTYDLLASLILFFLLFLFYQQRRAHPQESEASSTPGVVRFITVKRYIALILVPVLLIMAVFIFGSWLSDAIWHYQDESIRFTNINHIFFDEFFSLLIIVDVILLLFSFYHTNKFHKVMRNSGFVITTILIRLSFSVEGLLNTLLIITAVIFGLLIISIHNLFERRASGPG